MLNTLTLQSTIVGLLVLLFIIFQITESLDPSQETRCLNCIRNVSTSLGVDVGKRCEGYYCGQYQLSYTYWAEAGKPGNNQSSRDYEKCARDKSCAEQTVRAYFKKFKRDCNNDGLIDCLDMAALHKGGPTSCSSDWFYKSRYWLAFNKTNCMTNPQDQVLDGSKSDLDEQHNLRQPIRLMKNQTLTPECLDCICDAVSGCNTSVNNCGSGTVCGPFAISQAYWKDGRKPGASWTACTRTKECSSVTMKNYMEKYKRDCNDDGYITCEDYAAIHRRGPRACSNKDLLKDHYWNKFLACRANQKPVKDVNMVKVNEGSDESGNQNSLASRGDTNTLLVSTTLSPAIEQASSATNSYTFHSSGPTSTNIPQATTAGVTSSNRFDFQPKSPTYELTSLVLDVKEDNNSNSKSSTNKPVSQAFDHHHNHPHYHHHNHHRVNTQNNPSDVSKHKFEITPAKKPEASNQDYRPLSSTISSNHELPIIRKPTDYEELPVIAMLKQPSSTTSWALPTGAPTTTTPAVQAPTNQPTITTTSTPYMPTETTPIQPIMSAKQHFTESMHINHNEDMNPANGHDISPHQRVEQANQGAQSAPNFPLMEQSIPQPVPAEEIDYSMSEFPFSGQGSGADRATSFDKVVIGIVGNPDFSKSYPPVPDIVINQSKQSEQPTSLDEYNHQQQMPNKSQPKVSTNHSRSPNQATNKNASSQSQANESSQRATNKNNQKVASNANPTYQRSTIVQQQQLPQQQQQDADNNQPIAASIFGSESVNMSSLFEKGLNESSRIASECLECICDASTNCDTTVQCISKQREKNRCGLYMISWNQYQESDISLTSLVTIPAGVSEESADEKMYYECTTDRVCAEKLIHLYIEKHQKDCNNDGKIDCYDIAAIHRVGPENCNSGKFLGSQYWKDFNICYATDRLTTTVQPHGQLLA